MKKHVLNTFKDLALTAAILMVATCLGFLFNRWELHETNIVVIYIFSVLLISRFTTGYLCGISASVFSLLLFNWFFTEPYFTLKVNDPTYLITFFIMMFTSIVTSTLTTKAKQAAASREEATQERYRSNLLRAISHDIRTPLSVIMGTTEMLMTTTKDDEATNNLAKDIYRDAQWLHGMVENILSLTKLQNSKISLEKIPEAVEEVVESALAVIAKKHPDRVIDVEMPGHVVMAPMDARLISQTLINLLDNAAKHTPEKNEIKVTVCEDARFVHITVADRGCGIPEEDIPHVFRIFYTTSTKSPDTKRGVGLGLTICQSIVEAHGGEIRVRNRRNGGAAFSFTLPMGGN